MIIGQFYHPTFPNLDLPPIREL